MRINDQKVKEDYSKVYAPCCDPEQKAKVGAEVFPIDCEKTFRMGARLARETKPAR